MLVRYIAMRSCRSGAIHLTPLASRAEAAALFPYSCAESKRNEDAMSGHNSPEAASPGILRRSLRATPGLLLAGCVILALALRFWHLGDWNFQATEMFTLRDSNTPQFRNPRPLGYLLNYFLVRPFRPLDEFGLRLIPAICGTLAVPVFYYTTRRLIGMRAALIGTLLVTISPLIIMYSQLARYWSLVFLLCAIYPFALYLGVRDRNVRQFTLGVITALLAILAHPVSALLLGGPILFLVSQLRRRHLAQLWQHPMARWTLTILVAFAGLALLRLVPILRGWISQHDTHPGSGQFLLRPQPPPGVKQLLNLGAFAESLTLPVALIGVLGLYLLWRERDRELSLFLGSLVVFPTVFLALVSLRAPVSQYYLLPVVPVFFIGAGVFVDRLFGCPLGPRWLLPAAVITLVAAAGAPTLISDYRDGRRFDFRGTAQWLGPRLRPEDIVFSDQPMVLAHYLPGTAVQRLRQPAPLDQALQKLRQTNSESALWIVAPAPSHAFRANLQRGGLVFWIYDQCQLRNLVGVGRIDFRQDYLQIFRCPPSAVAGDSLRAARPSGLKRSTARP
jgi:hypothetical protein